MMSFRMEFNSNSYSLHLGYITQLVPCKSSENGNFAGLQGFLDVTKVGQARYARFEHVRIGLRQLRSAWFVYLAYVSRLDFIIGSPLSYGISRFSYVSLDVLAS